MKFKKYLLPFILLPVFINLSLAQPQTNLVSVNVEKNNLKISNGSELKVNLIIKIVNGWHINSNKPNDEFLIPTTISVKGNGVRLAKIKYPDPHEITLAFSDQPVSVYEGEVKAELTLFIDKAAPTGKQSVEIILGYQACNDQTCMPPTDVSTVLDVEVISGGDVRDEKQDTRREMQEVEEHVQNTVRDEAQEARREVLDVSNKVQDVRSEGLNKEEVSIASTDESTGIFLALVFAFIGGLILNLMPCVLPVLSLKIMGIVQQAGDHPKEKLKHGLIFTLGVLISFWILAGLLLILRAGGEQLGWGFQLQSPGFVIVLTIFLFLFGLSMFGVFEIGTTLTSIGQSTQNRSAYMGSFTSGVLATVVATPCTAPFMGSALGFALSQPVYVSLIIFTFLGLGMAAPYLILTTTPKLLKFIPKPGAWMESMKQFMGFLLLATVLWLLWVLSLQTGSEGVIILLASLIIVSLGGWIYGRWGNIAKAKPTRRIAQTISALTLTAALIFSLQNIEVKAADSEEVHRQGKIEWKKFSPELVEKLRSEGKPVFVDFTAAWCLSCQVNEKVAFGSEDVQDLFLAKGITALKADWTNKDETVTKALAQFGRNSVPFYILYVPGKSEPVIFPEIITPGIVIDKLDKNL
ncbi:MAG: thioredoxin family protein [Bacteroidota bacterium]